MNIESLGHYPLVVGITYAAVLIALLIDAGAMLILQIITWREWSVFVLKAMGVVTWVIIVLSVPFFIIMWSKS